jgi:hypothetical protein
MGSFDICTQPYIVRMIMSWRMPWEGHATRMREMWNAYTVLYESLSIRYHLGDVSVDWRIILK